MVELEGRFKLLRTTTKKERELIKQALDRARSKQKVNQKFDDKIRVRRLN